MDTTPDLDTLFAAIDNGDTAAVQAALHAGLSPNAADAKGCTLLHRACSLNTPSYEMVKLLLDAGADIRARDEYGRTAFAALVDCSGWRDVLHAEIMELLLAYGADINTRYQEGRTPLIEAAHSGQADMVEWLIQAGADVNATDDDGDTPLLLAAFGCGDYTKIGLLLRAGADPNRRSHYENDKEEGDTALDRVITDMVVFPKAHGERTFHLLHSFGAREGYYMELPVRESDDESPNKRLLRAVDNNNAPALLRQLAAGADVNCWGKSFFGSYTALMKAAHFGLATITRLLLEHGADATLRDDNGNTALYHAVHGDNAECIRLLLNAGVDPHQEKHSLLHTAANNGYANSVAALLRHTDLDPNAVKDGRTPRKEAERFFCEENLESGYGDIIVLLQRAEKK